MNVTFSRWHGKNVEALGELMEKWCISTKHVIRSASFKGGFEVFSLPNFRYDALTSLGLFAVLGTLGQIRGLAGQSQTLILAFLQEILSKVPFPNGVSILPDVVLDVEQGQTSFGKLWAQVSRQAKAVIRTRWENTASLGAKRSNCLGAFGVAELVWFWLRQPIHDGGIPGLSIERIQKRLIHLCAQGLEIALGKGTLKLSRAPPQVLDNDTFVVPADGEGESNFTASKTRNQAAQELRNELIRRFMTRNTGFVAGLKHSENKDLQNLGKGTQDNAAAIVAATQFCTAYFAKASFLLMSKIVKQEFRHISLFFDAASVCNYSIQELHVSTDGLVVAAPLSLLPQLKCPYEKSTGEVLQAIADTEPATALHEIRKTDAAASVLKLAEKTKAPTRQKLISLNQSLDYLLRLKLADTQPRVLLRPVKQHEKRCYTPMADGTMGAYLWNSVTKQSVWQTCEAAGSRTLMRMMLHSDEGETAAGLSLMEGGAMAIMIHRDTMHKLHRCQINATNAVPQIDEAISQVFLLLQFQAAPFLTGLFGRRLQECYSRANEIPLGHSLLQVCGPGIISEMGLDPSTNEEELKKILCEYAESRGRKFKAPSSSHHKQGRWGTFVDAFHRLKRTWSIELFFLMFAQTLEGISPFAALASDLEAGPTDEKAIMPRVLRVQDDRSPGNTLKNMLFVSLKWDQLMLHTMQSSLNLQNVQDICSLIANEDQPHVLLVHFQFLINIVKSFGEFKMQYDHFPWKFAMLLEPSKQDDILASMKREWAFVLKLEESGNVHGTWPMKNLVFLRWYAYREVMSFAEERQWKMSPSLKNLVKAWFSDPSSTLGCENAFRQLRVAEARHQSGKEVAVEKLQALVIKSINEQYDKFETCKTTNGDYAQIRSNMYIKRAVFDASRATASDTGVASFNTLVKQSTVSPNHLSRKSLSLWEALQLTNGVVTNLWSAQLARPLQVLSINDECWLVLDAPYYQLKVWPLSILQDDAGRFALLDAGEWRAKARRQCSFLPTRV
ncbi:Uncharacterized protein SCF082_LOCUS48761 [Durusdinium trenchii]|uniref:Uncharacterized protein n=1 Tax=Durusdinium trenchii TaxID=1381693 RepID=A0ABP0RV39_9DINO